MNRHERRAAEADRNPARASPNVLICMPTYGFVKSRTVESLVNLMSFTMANKVATLATYMEHKCTVIPMARNLMAHYAKTNGYDYIFFVDSDMQFPVDTLARLLGHNREVCGILCNKRVPQFEPVGQLEHSSIQSNQSGIAEAKQLGCGLLLVKTDVLERIRIPWFYDDPGASGEDTNFIRDLKAAGVSAWADIDLSFEVAHIGDFAIGWKRAGDGSAPEVTVL